MGVAIAVPLEKYEVNDVDITRIADTKYRPRSPRLTVVQQLMRNIFINPLFSVLNLLGIWKPKRSPWDDAYNRYNQMICMRLTPKWNENFQSEEPNDTSPAKKESFVVGTYHMPCAFETPAMMMIHCALSAQHIQRFARSNPYAFVGDFNIKPPDAMYALLTQGSVPPEHPHHPVNEVGDDWQPIVKPMRSAYKVDRGREPEFTNWAKTVRDKTEFIDTLDYIFLSPEWIVQGVGELPDRVAAGGPLPSEREPSDHLLLSASLSLPTASPTPPS